MNSARKVTPGERRASRPGGLPASGSTQPASARRALARQLDRLVATTPVFDIHTHLCDPAFRELLLWGIDDLLVYHYLTAEALRQTDVPYDRFWSLPKTGQADLIWDQLFVRH